MLTSLYKGKGLDTDNANSRPISPLNSIYEIFVAMLQLSVSGSIHEEHLRETQYGLRARRGTKHSLP